MSTAPPVVAVVVVHDPGPWFDDALDALAEQDYPNLASLFLVTGSAEGISERILTRLPDAHVRTVPENPGYGSAANEVLRLVEGSGFFCFLHDDVALDPDAISALVEELYRSNAGIVGPKLVEWDDLGVLQHAGLGVDRFGEIDPIVEPGEVDQEQHDAVRDVFCLPSACLLVRADLFRELAGFNPSIAFYGDDLDLCWRAHLSGARVLVVPAARGRHRERLLERRPDLKPRRMAARNRVTTVATLTGRWRTPLVLIEMFVVSVVEVVIGIFTGRAREGLASLYALFGLIPRFGTVLHRRREVRPLRHVADNEVVGLQERGLARFTSFMRQRERANAARSRVQVRRPGGMRSGTLVRVAVVALFLLGSRQLIRNGVPQVGQFVDLLSPRTYLHMFGSGWNQQGFGLGEAAPSSLGMLGLGGVVALGNTGLARLLLILLPVLLGYAGMWRFAGFFPSVRSRVAALVVYAAVPLPYTAIASGRWGVLATYGAMPWALDLVRRISGLSTVEGRLNTDDSVADAVVRVPGAQRLRMTIALGMITALLAAFVPVFPAVLLVAAALIVLATIVARGSMSVFAGLFAAVIAAVIAFVLNLPWSASLIRTGIWRDFVGPPLKGAADLGIVNLAQFAIGRGTLTPLALGLYLPLIAAPFIGRGWRLTWAARACFLVVGFGALAVLADRGTIPIGMPEPGILLVPVACGLALAGACTLSSFESDVLGTRLGWRQPVGLLVGAGLVIGLLPGPAAVIDGSWRIPSRGLAFYLEQLPQDPNDGDYRVAFIGDPRVVPLAPRQMLYDGVAYSVADDGPLGSDDQWLGTRTAADEQLTDAMRAIADVTTLRAGRLLGPLGVRYLVIPIDDGVNGGKDHPIAPPAGLIDALTAQLDLRRVDSPDQLVIFENTAWTPVRAMLDGTESDRSNEAGAAALVSKAPGGRTPVLVGSRYDRQASGEVPAGTFNLAVPRDSRWVLDAGGKRVTSRASYGWSMAFDAVPAGTATLRYDTSPWRPVLLSVQGLLWLIALLVALGDPGATRPTAQPAPAGPRSAGSGARPRRARRGAGRHAGRRPAARLAVPAASDRPV